MAQQIQPKREIKKGDGAWVTEILSDPVTNAVLRVTSFTKEQLLDMKETTEKRYKADLVALEEMIALL